MTRAERGQQIWQVLVSAAHNRQVLTYGLLAGQIGMGAGTLAGPLGTVLYYCEQKKLPPLTALVVNIQRGRPGSGFPSGLDLDKEREKVFAFEWFKRLPPTDADLEQAFEQGGSSTQ